MKIFHIPMSWLCNAIRLGVLALFGLRLWSISTAFFFTEPGTLDEGYVVKNIYIPEVDLDPFKLPLVAKLTNVALQVPTLLMLAYGGCRLFKLLRNFERNSFFGGESISHLRAFSAALLLSSLFTFAETPLRSIVFSWMQWSNMKYFAMMFSIQDLGTPLLCAMFYLIARAMEEGQRLAQENREFI